MNSRPQSSGGTVTLSVDEAIKHANLLFDQEQAVEGQRVVLELAGKGIINWELLDRAWKAADEDDDSTYMSQVLEAFQQAAPDYSDARLDIFRARLFKKLRQWQEMVEAIRRARAGGWKHDRLDISEAYALERLFRPEEALKLLEGKNFQGEEFDYANLTRAVCYDHLKKRDTAKAVLDEWLPVAGDNRATVGGYKLRGKLFDREGDTGAAWEDFSRGNKLASRLYEKAIGDNGDRWYIETWRTLFKREWVDRFVPVTYDGFTPVFLIGFPRSGTTLLEQVLDAHPRIQAVEEPPTVYRAMRTAATMMQARAAMKGRLAGHIGRLDFMVRSMEQLAYLGDKELDNIRNVYFQVADSWSPVDRDKVFVDKMPLNTLHVGFLARLFPKAKFVVALRHPADALLSCYMQDFEQNAGMANFYDLEHAFSFYHNVMQLLWQYERVLGLSERMHYIRYEDLLTDLEGEAGRLLNFLDLPWDEAVTRYYEHARERSLATPSYQGVTQKLYMGAMNRWHRYAQQLQPYLHHIQPACRKYGYSLEITTTEDEKS